MEKSYECQTLTLSHSKKLKDRANWAFSGDFY